MANRRMFSKTITNSSRFLMMSPTAQILYIHFGMNADDDGFCEHFSIMRMTESKPDDLKILQAKGFVKVFDDQVLVITEWKENNYLQKDRYTPSKYLTIYKEEMKELNSGIQNVYRPYTQDRIGKDRIGKRETVKEIKITKKTIDYLLKVPASDYESLVKGTSATEENLTSKAEDLYNWCKYKGKKIRDFKALLRNALKKDYPPKDRFSYRPI